jgi:tetratricopeptide (TPR) repeat protein
MPKFRVSSGAAALAALLTFGSAQAAGTATHAGAATLKAAEQCLSYGQYACAEPKLKLYLKAHPDDVHAQALLAITDTRLGNHTEAIPLYRKVLDQGEGTYDLFAGYAISLDAVGELDESIKYNRRALEIVPNLVDVRGMLARQLVKQGKLQEARDLLQSFDDYLVKQGVRPYFTAQIMAIDDKIAKQKAEAAPAPK